MRLSATFLLFTLRWVLALPEEARFLTYVPPSPNLWTLIGACTGGRCPGTESGTLKSTNYPGNYPDKTDTKYILETEQGSTILLTFEAFSLEAPIRGSCLHDYVKVIDSDDNTELAILCGDERPAPIKSTRNKMTLFFYTDESINGEGFQASWKSLPNPKSGEFKSPNYPKNYEKNTDITKTLEAPKGSSIEITVIDFKTERCCDYLRISDREGNTLARYSGTYKKDQLPEPLISQTNKLILNFFSDFSGQRRGFILTWKHIEEACPDTRFLTYVPPSPNLWTLIGACTGGRCPGTESGTLKSANYPGNYPDKIDTKYILETEQGSTILLTFEAFSLEAPLLGICDHDYVKVIDSDDNTELAILCGVERPAPLKSRGNKMTLIFYSDESINSEGFQANWKSSPNPISGEFKSPNYPELYEDGASITKLLEAPKGSRIEIAIKDFETEFYYDYLTVFDGDGNEIAEYSGKYDQFDQYDRYHDYYYYYDGYDYSNDFDDQIPETLRSPKNKLILRFYSDGSVQRRGFRLTWKHID